MKVGNVLGLPVNLLLFAVVVVVMTAGSVEAVGEMLMDPVEIVARIDNPVAVFVGSVTFIIATMGINIVAYFVSPAYDFANLLPRHIGFKRGGLITSVLAAVVCPWIFVDSPQAITVFERGAGGVLGRFIVDRIIRPRLVCSGCDRFAQAPLPSWPIERGWPGPGLLARVLVAKYGDHLPLCRQSQIIECDDIERSTLADWVSRSTAPLEPLAGAIGRQVLAEQAVFGPGLTGSGVGLGQARVLRRPWSTGTAHPSDRDARVTTS